MTELGYEARERVWPLHSTTVVEGKLADTLEAMVTVFVKVAKDDDGIGLAMSPDYARALAQQLTEAADEADAKDLWR